MIVSRGWVVDLDLGQAHGWLVIDFLIMGMCWGGIRMQHDVTRAETEMLARMMTLKSALAGVPIGGAKIGIVANPTIADKKTLTLRLAERLRDLILKGHYIAGSDIGFWENDLQHLYSILDIRGRFTLHRGGGGLSATGLAVAESLHASIETLTHFYEMDDIETVALQGFGNMGSAAGYLLSKRGYKLVAVSNRYHTLVDPRGLDIHRLLDLRQHHGEECLRKYAEEISSSRLLPSEDVLRIKADIFIPSARPLSILGKPSCRIIAPLANYPLSITVGRELEHSGIKVIPDIISTAGGAIASALTILERSFEDDLATVAAMTRDNMYKILEVSQEKGVDRSRGGIQPGLEQA